jgi:hypothetical protein
MVYKTIFNFLINLFSFIKFYLIWIILHYVSTHAYAYICTPIGFTGFISSPLLAISPICKSINWIRSISIYTIENMWYLFGLWSSTKITTLFQGINNT